MKFYDLEWLAEKCGTDNKYEITARIAAEARKEAEESNVDRGNPGNERFISNVLNEIEEGKSPITKKQNDKTPQPDAEPATVEATA